MAQRTEKEETEIKVPETITLCANNCGVIGNPATNNMCQKCFNATTSATTTSTTSSPPPTTSTFKFSSDKSRVFTSSRSRDRSDALAQNIRKTTSGTSRSEESYTISAKRGVNRCSGCHRKVGLTGFRCRCGELFCAEHRYSDRHDCSYDYKSVGRQAIARENPVVKAAKIVRV